VEATQEVIRRELRLYNPKVVPQRGDWVTYQGTRYEVVSLEWQMNSPAFLGRQNSGEDFIVVVLLQQIE